MGYELHGEGMDGRAVDRVAQVGAGPQFLGKQGITTCGQSHKLAGMKVLLWVGGSDPPASCCRSYKEGISRPGGTARSHSGRVAGTVSPMFLQACP